jgi:hypothetical protein
MVGRRQSIQTGLGFPVVAKNNKFYEMAPGILLDVGKRPYSRRIGAVDRISYPSTPELCLHLDENTVFSMEEALLSGAQSFSVGGPQFSTLVDPRDREVRWVGKSLCPKFSLLPPDHSITSLVPLIRSDDQIE